MRINRLAFLIGAACLTASCAAAGGGGGPRGGFIRPPGEARIGTGRLFVSPAGAVYRADERVRTPPIVAWFAAADADGNGVLDWAEMQADFERAFVSFDLDGDGEIEPDEVTHYETRVLPEIATPGMFGGGPSAAASGAQRGSGGRPPQGSRGGGGGGGAAMMSGAARFGLLPISHPIMDADENFNRGINRIEWAAAARQRFDRLDRGRTGALSLDQLQRPHAGPPPGGQRPPRSRPD